MYTEQTIKKYFDDLSAKLPAPGGGSASALVSVTGISLLCMVANYTVDKKGYEQYQQQIKQILVELEEQKRRLIELVDLDVQEYKTLSETYKLPKNTETEKQIRDKKIQESLKNALNVPFEIMDISYKGLFVAEKLSEIGNKNLISDVECGIVFLKSAIQAAKFNVDINLVSIKDTEFVQQKKIQIISILNNSK